MKTMNALSRWSILVGVLLSAAATAAEFPPPDVVVRTTSEDVLRLVADDKDLRNGATSKLVDLIETKVVPHFDMTRVTRLAVGKYWTDATPEQQKVLVDEFHTLLVRSYAAAYSAYRLVKVEVTPLQLAANDNDVIVKSRILLPGGAPPVGVDYAMRLSAEGWKVYNVTVDGASLVTTYRNDFAGQIQTGGIEGLIKYLKERNAKALAAPAKK